ncbi:unknown [Bacteroides sp. CAG:633]|nr:unknown [Bacteroides sp. CAG:633]
MWPAIVVEVDVSTDDLLGMPDIVEVTLSVDTFALDYPVDPLGDGIVCRVVVLRHANVNLVRL